MPSQATITSKTGAAQAVTALVIANVTGINFQIDRQVVSVSSESTPIRDFELYNTVTVTYTIATRVATIVVSQ